MIFYVRYQTVLQFLNAIDYLQFSLMNISFVYTVDLFEEIVVSNILYHTEESMCYLRGVKLSSRVVKNR